MSLPPFTKRIKALRKAQFLSRSELAERSGVSERTIIRLELGEGRRTTTRVLLDLAKALGVVITYDENLDAYVVDEEAAA